MDATATSIFWYTLVGGSVLWFAFIILLVERFGSRSEVRDAHRANSGVARNKSPRDVLNERYARGEITQSEFKRMRPDIAAEQSPALPKSA